MHYSAAIYQVRNKHSQKVALANMYHNLFKTGEVQAIKVEVDEKDPVIKTQ